MSTPALRVITAGLEKQQDHLQHLIDTGAPTVQDLRDVLAEQQRFLELARAAESYTRPDAEVAQMQREASANRTLAPVLGGTVSALPPGNPPLPPVTEEQKQKYRDMRLARADAHAMADRMTGYGVHPSPLVDNPVKGRWWRFGR